MSKVIYLKKNSAEWTTENFFLIDVSPVQKNLELPMKISKLQISKPEVRSYEPICWRLSQIDKGQNSFPV